MTVIEEIMHSISMPSGSAYEGWCAETARLYALDVAHLFVRRYMSEVPTHDWGVAMAALQEARVLTMSGRAAELGFIQGRLEIFLSHAKSRTERAVWYLAIDALAPGADRAALAATRNAIRHTPNQRLEELKEILQSRLAARLLEGRLVDIAEPNLRLIS